jgi:hypothetical protein
VIKRCVFCGKKLDDKGYCQNTECPDYLRTKIMESSTDSSSTTTTETK